jgi:hypothetical protein
MTSKVTPIEAEELKDVKTNQPIVSNQQVVLTSAQPKKIIMPSMYSNSII